MNQLIQLATQFRRAIDNAKDAAEFTHDISFNKFPLGCCGDASDLLAQFLLEQGIKTYYVCGTYYGNSFEDTQSHAWLLTSKNTIIDITGDQFKFSSTFLNYNKAVYVGKTDDFHKLFEYENRDIHENTGISNLGAMCQHRLFELYHIILKYLSN